MIERKKLAGTPFVLITVKDNGCFGSFQNIRLTPTFLTEEETITYVAKHRDEMLMNAIMTLVDTQYATKDEVNKLFNQNTQQ